MTCPTCNNLRFVPCPRSSVKTVCARSCEVCHGKHMIPCRDCEAHQEHEEIHASAEADSILAQMDEALGPLAKKRGR
jgi:hypothetical protein